MAQKPYTFVAWPSWRYGPNGEAEVFQSEDEVPEGWLDHPAKFKNKVAAAQVQAGKKPAQEGSVGDTEAKIKVLLDDNDHGELVEILEAMAEENDAIEFSKAWPKLKLAQMIVDNGGPAE